MRLACLSLSVWNVFEKTSGGAVSKRSQAVNGENGRGQSELAVSAPVPAGADTQAVAHERLVGGGWQGNRGQSVACEA